MWCTHTRVYIKQYHYLLGPYGDFSKYKNRFDILTNSCQLNKCFVIPFICEKLLISNYNLIELSLFNFKNTTVLIEPETLWDD